MISVTSIIHTASSVSATMASSLCDCSCSTITPLSNTRNLHITRHKKTADNKNRNNINKSNVKRDNSYFEVQMAQTKYLNIKLI